MSTHDAIVIGGGLVGGAIGYGLARGGLKVALLDEGDTAFRAARGNFGLVWVQSKGAGVPEYQCWSRLSSELWVDFAAELRDATGVDPMHERRGGLRICLSEQELEERCKMVEQIRLEQGAANFEYQVLGREELKQLIPAIGPEVAGATYTRYDGAVNPLPLLRALHAAILRYGGKYAPHARVTAIAAEPNEFTVEVGGTVYLAPRLVIAAGLGNKELAPFVGLDAPVRPVRGNIIATERVAPAIPLTQTIRQMPEGGLLLGDSYEEAGYDDFTALRPLRDIASRAVRAFPFLRDVNVVRTWAALRVMSPDGLPIYEQSRDFPGAFVATCHSGVTLAAAHALRYAPHVIEGKLPAELARFASARFHVQKAA
ncbi:MAG: FAD-dependent oxidoreductase [Betaproteobacteria bacterium RIFCSPLOWO2_12_FULL_62_13]|nr:MAG: FAD-dependent oxidoreductase [Betaproteobacteria bacterium RIFCSPLOWO2_12_FULL_62_13]